MSAGDETTTKDQTPAGPAAEKPEDTAELTSLEDLDQIIAEQDPEFKSRVDQISSDASAGDLQIELIDLDQLLKEQEEKSLRSRVKRLIRKFRNFSTGLRTTAWYFLKNELPLLLKKGLGHLKSGIGVLQEGLRQFGFKPRAYKLKVFAFILLCGVSATAIVMLLKSDLLTPEDQLFMKSMSEMAEESHQFDPKTEMESFYDSVRSAQNIVATPKLVVNIKRSVSSGSNPMMAAELYVEGNSPDVIVEIKDREVEFRDGFMRTMEEFTYDDLDSPEGKQRMLEKLTREANRLATKGRVRKMFFKTIILKP